MHGGGAVAQLEAVGKIGEFSGPIEQRLADGVDANHHGCILLRDLIQLTNS